jgi:hypothetical protein
MISCFESYLRTTDPKAKYVSLIDFHVVFSIVFHTFIYVLVIKGLMHLFSVKHKNISYLVVVLVLLMVFGYAGRLYRAKTIYQGFLDRGYSDKDALIETRDYMRTGYFTYYFMG